MTETKVVVFANTKGGSAKTTSTICVATALAGQFDVEVWDADPQGSASDWADMAAEAGESLPFKVEAINLARLKRVRQATTADYVLIDTPPGNPPMIDAAIGAADLVILPTASTAMDLERTIMTIENIPAEIPRVALITRTNKQTVAYRDAMELLQSQDDLAVFSTGINNREAIHHSYGSRPRIFHEYSVVTDEILEILQ